MKHRSAQDLKGFLQSLSPRDRAIVAALRGTIASIVPTATESILWGGISYHRPSVGGRVKGSVCQITAKHGEVRLDFIHGIRLRDPHGLLRGDLVSKRFVVIGSPEDARRPELIDIIRDAGELSLGSPSA